MYDGVSITCERRNDAHVSVLTPNQSSCRFPRTWGLTSSRPAHRQTTLTVRPCPSERAPSRHAPTWRDSWTLSKTVRGNVLCFMLARSAGLSYGAFSLSPKLEFGAKPVTSQIALVLALLANTTLHDSSCLEATSRMCSAKRSTGLSVALIQ